MSYHKDLMTAIAGLLADEGFTGIPEERVYVKKLPDPAAVQFPCLLVSLEGCKETCDPIDTEHDERVLPVAVLLLDRSDRRDDDDLDDWLDWLQDGVNALLMQLYHDVPACWHADVKPMESLDSQRIIGPEYGAQASGWMVSPRVITDRRRPT